MQLPDYWLQRPPGEIDNGTRRAFDELLDAALAAGGGPRLDYQLPAPKWQFLCHVADQRGLALHGSGNGDIALFEPRQADDLSEFGRQRAVYAASDGLWAMFFAIVDRDRFALSVTNACVRLADAAGRLSAPYYYFSVSQMALPRQPWRAGTVYLLPPDTFTAQAPLPFGEAQAHIAQLASPEPVAPLARLAVTPQDFPFLPQIRGHDDARLAEYAAALQAGAPLPEGGSQAVAG
jgi:hypothetical protein